MKKKISFDNLLTIGFYVLLALTLVWDITARDGGKVLRIFLIAFTILAVKLVFMYTFLKKSKASYIVILIFIFASMYLANVMNFYNIPHYDKILHFFSGSIIAVFGFIVFTHFFGDRNNGEKIYPKTGAMLLFVVMFCAGAAAFWEIWEFTTDSLFGLLAQNGLEDTMWDIILGTFGGMFIFVPIALYEKGKNIKWLEKIAKEMM
ncbi:MAG: hypothetical protein ACRC7N_11635 [Clostridium sp.]